MQKPLRIKSERFFYAIYIVILSTIRLLILLLFSIKIELVN